VEGGAAILFRAFELGRGLKRPNSESPLILTRHAVPCQTQSDKTHQYRGLIRIDLPCVQPARWPSITWSAVARHSPPLLAPTMCVYSTREELRCFRFQSSNPKRKRGRALPPSLTLRVTFQAPRVQYKSKTFARTLRHQFDFSTFTKRQQSKCAQRTFLGVRSRRYEQWRAPSSRSTPGLESWTCARFGLSLRNQWADTHRSPSCLAGSWIGFQISAFNKFCKRLVRDVARLKLKSSSCLRSLNGDCG
jgi:hypothetical protein